MGTELTGEAGRIELVRHSPNVGGLHRAGQLLAMSFRALGYMVDETEMPDVGVAPLPPRSCALRVACVNADQFHRVPHVEGVPLVGWWSWELSVFRKSFVRAERGLTAVWTLSEHAAQALVPSLHVPVRVLPLPVAEPPRRAVAKPERFQVLVVADHGSGSARKNAAAGVRAYRRAFAPESGANLVVKTTGSRGHPGAARRIQRLAAGRTDIRIVDARLSRDDMLSLLAGSDVLLSLHRAEGYGLPLAEAMSAGVVAVATAYGGPLDFMTDANCVLVPYRLVRVGPGHWPYPAGARWAEPDEEAAARALVRLRQDPAARIRLGERAEADLRAAHALSARLPLLRGLVDEAIALGPSSEFRELRPMPKPLSRWFAGGLHKFDVHTGGRWEVLLAPGDRWRSRLLRT